MPVPFDSRIPVEDGDAEKEYIVYGSKNLTQQDGKLSISLAVTDAASGNDAVKIQLLPAKITEVSELGQKWNKVPNPKNPGYANWNQLISADKIDNILFTAPDPTSNNVQLTVTTNLSGSKLPFLCGVRDVSDSDTGPLLSAVKAVAADGIAQLDFAPTGSCIVKEYKIVLGFDSNRDGKLDESEVISDFVPKTNRFYIRAPIQHDRDGSYDALQIFAKEQGVAGNFLRYFLGFDSSILDAPSPTTTTFHITDKNPTQIAGSPYDQASGDTQVPTFTLPVHSTSSDEIISTFNLPATSQGSPGGSDVPNGGTSTGAPSTGGGLQTIIFNVWYNNKAKLIAAFHANGMTDPLPIATPTISFYDHDDELNGVMHDLHYAFGEATITGTVQFTVVQSPSDPHKLILSGATINAVINDLYDFDWTRKPLGASNRGAMIQIGWRGVSPRTGGKIFVTNVIVNNTYGSNDPAVTRFNANPSYSVTLP